MLLYENCERFDTSGPAYWVRSMALPARTEIAFLQSAMLSAPLSSNLSAGQMVRSEFTCKEYAAHSCTKFMRNHENLLPQASPMTMSVCCGPKHVENSLSCQSIMR